MKQQMVYWVNETVAWVDSHGIAAEQMALIAAVTLLPTKSMMTMITIQRDPDTLEVKVNDT